MRLYNKLTAGKGGVGGDLRATRGSSAATRARLSEDDAEGDATLQASVARSESLRTLARAAVPTLLPLTRSGCFEAITPVRLSVLTHQLAV